MPTSCYGCYFHEIYNYSDEEKRICEANWDLQFDDEWATDFKRPDCPLIEEKRGKWVDTEPHLKDWQQRKNGMAYYCSVCGHRAGKNKHRTYKYCPWCGARMDGE